MQIFITRGEDSSGPFTLEQVQDCLTQGTLLPEDLAYHEGLEGWIPLSELMNSITSPESTVSGPLTKKAVLVGIAQRVFACLIIVGFFLPWCSDQSLRIAETKQRLESEIQSVKNFIVGDEREKSEAAMENDKVIFLQEFLSAKKAMSGASGLDLATKEYPDRGNDYGNDGNLSAIPTLFLVPLLALVGAVAHKRMVYIGCTVVTFINLLVVEYILGHTVLQHPNPVLWGIYLILVIVFITGIVMPKEGRSGEIVESTHQSE